MTNQFNIRIYGLCLKDGHLLALHEMYAGEKLLKLPGGGLEFKEGSIECLEREFLEELNLKIDRIEHFYTQEEFVVSRFRKNEQLFTVYYTCELTNESDLLIKEPSIEKVEWISLREENPFLLPVDQKVFALLTQKFL
ncbi:NUDIX domain-containing protein [Chryseobacterium sp. A301]